MATNNSDFKVKKGLEVTENISVSGDIDVSSLYGRLNFKKNADGNVNNDAIFFINGSDQYAGAVKYFHSGNTLRFDANQETQLHISDGAIFPPTDDDVDLGTSSLKFKDSFFGLVDAENFKVNGGQGSDGQVLTSTGSGVAWENAAGGGASAIGGLDDVLMDATNFTNGFLLQLNSDGSAPTTGTLNSATGNIGLGEDVLANLTSADYNIAIGNQSLNDVTTGGYNIAIGGWGALQKITTQSNNIGIGSGAGENITNGAGNICIGGNASKGNSGGVASSYNVAIGHDVMYAINGVANNNVAIGKYAMRDGLTTGDDNVAIGESAGRNITSASNLVFIGKEAGNDNTTGLRNIAIGYKAYDNADTESDNIAIGYDALGGAVAGGEKNLAIGNYTLDALTSGDQNVALGYNAGGGITEGNSNVAIGHDALTATLIYGENVAIGQNALKQLTGDSYANTAIGRMSSTVMTYGEENTTIGYYSGAALADGAHRNILIGSNAGDNITTGDNNVVIGKADVTATGSDQLSISSGDGSPVWITGDSDGGLELAKNGAGRLQIGDSSLNPTNMNLGKVVISRDDSGSSPAGPTLSLVDGDDDSNGGPGLKMYRNTASPADGDNLGFIAFNGEDSAGGERGYATIMGISDDITSGTTDGALEFKVRKAGTTTVMMRMDASGVKALLGGVKAVSSNTTLTDDESGSYVYWTGGTLTLPATAEVGQQFVVINNTGGSATPGLGTSNDIASGWTAHAAMDDETARTYMCPVANKWIYIG